jgi:protease IV
MADYVYPEPTGKPVAPPPNRKHTSGKAIFAFLLGGMSIVLWVFTGLPAFILALQAKSDMRRNPNIRGRGLANLGLLFSFAGMFILPILIMAAMVSGSSFSFGEDTYVDNSDRIVHLHFSGMFSDAPVSDPFMMYGGSSIALRDLIDTIEQAEYDDTVVAIVMTMDSFRTSLAQAEEIYNALDSFKQSNKKIFVHSEEASLSTGAYALFSVATDFNMVPTGTINLVGMYSESMYLKNGLDSIGIKADIVHIGDYKSAGEMVMLSEPSPAADEATNWMLDSLYETMVEMIETGRPDINVLKLIDDGPYSAAQAEEAKLIDSRMYMDELTAVLEDEYGDDIYFANNYNGLYSMDSMGSDEFEWFPTDNTNPMIGLIYLEGTIMSGYGSGGIYSGTARRAIEAAQKDDSIEAVVIRINTGGGSVTASEVILRSIQELNDVKPVVISMGDVAASGGYYIACQADAIFANEATITGSIGVVGGKIVTKGLWDELGINWQPYQRGANADWVTGAAPFTKYQREQIVESMGAAYRTFKDHVHEGRQDKLTKELEEMAGGRVFTGKQALELGLVDEIGGLDDALYYAADLVDLDDFDVKVVPEVLDFGEALLQELFGTGENPRDMSINPLSKINSAERIRTAFEQQASKSSLAKSITQKFDPERSRAIFHFLQSAELINMQGNAAVMPEHFYIQ